METPEQVKSAISVLETLRSRKVAQLRSLQDLIDSIDLTIDQTWALWKDAYDTAERLEIDATLTQMEAEES